LASKFAFSRQRAEPDRGPARLVRSTCDRIRPGAEPGAEPGLVSRKQTPIRYRCSATRCVMSGARPAVLRSCTLPRQTESDVVANMQSSRSINPIRRRPSPGTLKPPRPARSPARRRAQHTNDAEKSEKLDKSFAREIAMPAGLAGRRSLSFLIKARTGYRGLILVRQHSNRRLSLTAPQLGAILTFAES
jgi:hypothetical protein